MNIYVGNLAFDTTEEELRAKFEAYGQVTSVNIITDRYSGRARGFAFVEMASDQEGQAAIDALNSQEFKGRTLKIEQARPRTERGGRDDRRSGGGRGFRSGGERRSW